MIRLLQLELHNFLSHVDTVLNFDTYEGLVLIEGQNHDGHYSSNGSGKSTLLEGIVYALTGDTLRGVSVNDVVNRNYKKNTRVTLKFLKDQDQYEVSRYRKDEKNGDSIVLMKNGENISKRVNKETQALLDNILGISFKVFVSTILLGEGLSSRFTQLSDPEKKSLIESTLNLNYDMNELRAKANSRRSKLELESSNLSGRISSMKEYSAVDITSLEAIIADFPNRNAFIQDKISSIERDLANLTPAREAITNKMNLVFNSINQIDRLTESLSMMDLENSRLIAELTDAETCEDPHCTVCHQSLRSEASKEAFKSSYREKIDSLSKMMLDVRAQLDALPDRAVLVSSHDKFSFQLADIDADMKAYNDQLVEYRNKAYQVQSEYDRCKYDIEKNKESKEDIQVLEKEYNDTLKDIEIYEYFYKLFSPTGIVVNILSEAVGYINDRLSTYSEVLLDKRYHIEFVKGKISLKDDTGSSYQSLSNGEKRRLDIAIQFSLHDYVHMYCGMKLNCCYIDEVLDTLDDIGVDNIFDVLRLKLEYCGLSSIYIITHNDTLKSKFDHIITVMKNENGDSFIR